jgi:hypothetical protein
MTSALALHLKDPRELYQGSLDPDLVARRSKP